MNANSLNSMQMQFADLSKFGGSPAGPPKMMNMGQLNQGNNMAFNNMGMGNGGPAGGFQQPGPGFNQNMMQQSNLEPQNRPQQDKKPSLKVQLSDKEKGYYSNLLMQADPSGNNKVGGQQGVGFFKRSGLPTDVLKSIWLISARTSNEFLTRDEFYIALRLIAYAQNGIQPNEDSIKFNIDVALPRLEAAPLALPPSESMKPEVRAEDIAASLPDLDNLNLDALNSIQSLIPSVNKAEQHKQIHFQQQQMMKQQQMMQRNMLQHARGSPWFLSEEDITKYQKIFAMFDKQGQGFISGSQMRDVLDQTKLDKNICDMVWNLVNPQQLDRFDKTMFMITMHFLYKKKATNIDLPATIPEETYMSIEGENYFRLVQQRLQSQQMNQGLGIQPQQFSTSQQFNPPGGNLLSLDSIAQPQNKVDPNQFQSEVPIMNNSLNKSSHQSYDLVNDQGLPNNNRLSGQNNFNQDLQKQISPMKNQNIMDQSRAPPAQQFQTNFSAMNQSRSQNPSPKNGISSTFKIDPSKIATRKEEIAFLNNIYKQDQQSLTDLQSENQKLQKTLDELEKEFQSIKLKIEQQRTLLQQEKQRTSLLRQQIDDKSQQVNQQRSTYDNVIQERVSNLEQFNTYSNGNGYQQDFQRKDSYGTNNQQQPAYNDNYGYNNGYQQNDQQYNRQSTEYNGNGNGNGGNNAYSNYQQYDNGYDQQYANGGSNNYDQQQQQQQQNNYNDGGSNNNKNTGSNNFAARFDFDNFDSDIYQGSGQEFNGKFDFT